MNELHLFAGAGGGILGSELLGIRTVCAVELEPYPASVLLARQNDGILPPFPVWDDVCTFDGRPWHGIVDVVSGGFPCQDISVSGKRKGLEEARSGLWSEMARIICEVRPGFVFLENSPNLTRLGLDRVLGNLAEMGYDAEWCVLGADAWAKAKKPFRIHPQKGMGVYRYYICEPGIIAFDDLPGLWGLLYVLPGGRIREIRPSGRFPDVNRAAEISLLTACLYIQKPLKIKNVYGEKVQYPPAFGEGAKETKGI